MPDEIACRSYTHARRYPWVIGSIGGWQLPTQLSLSQLAAMGLTLLVLVQTRALWAHLPRMGNLLVEVSLPAVAAWGARHLQVEGRSPVRALLGALMYLSFPRAGRIHGRPRRNPGPVRLTARLPVQPTLR
ncbi:MAG TPA: TcpE family conjugal transfer membrane protein [Actinomycetota bacterium]|nr:TcpE family conjugal transfer membrane protein [Actinomycetota bacterium]